MLLNSQLSEEHTTRWVKLKLDPEDDPVDNRVGGELQIQYKYRPKSYVNQLLQEQQKEDFCTKGVKITIFSNFSFSGDS